MDMAEASREEGGPSAQGGACQRGQVSSQVEEMSLSGGVDSQSRSRWWVGARPGKVSCRDLGLKLELQQDLLACCEVLVQ